MILMVTPFSVATAADSIQFDTKTGLFVIKRGGAPLVDGNFVFWKGEWQWAMPELATNIIAPGQYSVTSNTKPDQLNIAAQSVFDGPGRLRWLRLTCVTPGTFARKQQKREPPGSR